MKSKKFDKRLSLGKSTIANLGDIEQRRVKGGVCTELRTGCNTYPVQCYTYPEWNCPSEPSCPVCVETDAC